MFTVRKLGDCQALGADSAVVGPIRSPITFYSFRSNKKASAPEETDAWGFLDKTIPYRPMYNNTTRPAQTPAHPRGSVTFYGRSPGS